MDVEDGIPEEDDSLETDMSEIGEESETDDDNLAQAARGRGNDNEQRGSFHTKFLQKNLMKKLKLLIYARWKSLKG